MSDKTPDHESSHLTPKTILLMAGVALVAFLAGRLIISRQSGESATGKAIQYSRPTQQSSSDQVSTTPSSETNGVPPEWVSRDPQNVTFAIKEMSERSGIPEEKIRRMRPAEMKELENRCLAQKFGKSEDEYRKMTAVEKYNLGIKQLAERYGLTEAEVERFGKIQSKQDAGLPLTADESAFLQSISKKLK